MLAPVSFGLPVRRCLAEVLRAVLIGACERKLRAAILPMRSCSMRGAGVVSCGRGGRRGAAVGELFRGHPLWMECAGVSVGESLTSWITAGLTLLGGDGDDGELPLRVFEVTRRVVSCGAADLPGLHLARRLPRLTQPLSWEVVCGA